jgi:hypothetical protein
MKRRKELIVLLEVMVGVCLCVVSLWVYANSHRTIFQGLSPMLAA